MKRRTLLAGIAGGSVAVASGLLYRRWATDQKIQLQELAQYVPSKDYDKVKENVKA